MPDLLAGVIGYPIKHSLSPEIFKFFREKTGVTLVYERISVYPGIGPGIGPASLDRKVKELKTASAVGWNVTIPFKETMTGYVDRCAREVEAIGAINVIQAKDGSWIGHNTDCHGFAMSLDEAGADVEGRDVAVFGAGGASRAVCYALGLKRARRVVVINRDLERARELVRRFSRVFEHTEYGAMVFGDIAETIDADIYVNATPLGMEGFDEIEFPKNARDGGLAFDLVYKPLETGFLKGARARGLKTIDGLEMLIWQAIATFEIWFGKGLWPSGPPWSNGLHDMRRIRDELRAKLS